MDTEAAREEPASAGNPSRLTRHYALVLASIVVSFAFLGAAPAEDWAAFSAVLLQSATLLLALWVSGAPTLLMRIGLVAVLIALAGAAGLLFGADATPADRSAAGGSLLLHGLIVAAVPFAIGRGLMAELRQSRRVTAPTLLGALCIYLLIGMFFSAIYGAIGAIDSGPFFAQEASATAREFLYFSFVTLTTLGYGDLSPAEPLGRMLAVIEALVGQIYLVTVIALVVGTLGASLWSSGQSKRRAAG